MPRNTAAEAKTAAGAMFILANAMGRENPSDAILDMEAQGQRELVREAGTRLPADGSEALWVAAAGIIVTGPVPGDDLFIEAVLPAGWIITPTDHAMWSDLRDAQGRKRASIFYKAAFYDRDAYMRGEYRFGVSQDYESPESGRATHYVYDATLAPDIHDKAARLFVGGDSAGYADTDIPQAACGHWLDEHYPNWKDVAAYWD